MSEVRALLLTDVVDSTRLSEELGDVRMALVWAAHDRAARDLLPLHDGLEIDKTDGFLLLFSTVDDAVAYAVAYHRAIAALEPPLAARAGLHVGPVILTKNSAEDVARGAKPLEVDGMAKPIAARVMSVASGGQTLLTQAAHDALESPDLETVSHGYWRMKGVAEPIGLFEVGGDSAPLTPPPDGAKVYRVVEREGLWLPVREIEHSLPAERDAFVGRTSDLLALARLVDSSRLVGVLGVGGAGKTRLVTRFAWTWLGDFPGGVWFCDLSEARSIDGIASAVATALDVSLGSDDPIDRLGRFIAGRGVCLVVLDNFEQVARHAPQTLGTWLDRAAEARFVVTTREVLGLPGETVLPLAPLGSDESRDLFVTRARRARPDFSGDDETSIRSLVALLDGLPLAIELAAARVRVMTPETLLQRMGQRFRVLASAGGRHTRQATLRATLDWSWDLLSSDERAALAQLSVFEGGFTLEAAETVLILDQLWPMDAVQGLVDKSLVRQVTDDRFDLLVSVQVYAAEKLDEAGTRADAEAHHARFFARYGAPDAHGGAGGGAAMQALGQELDNVVAACGRSVVSGASERAVSLLGAAWVVISQRGPALVAIGLCEQVAAMPSLSRGEQSTVRMLLGTALSFVGREAEALPHLNEALAAAREIGDRRAEGHTHSNLAVLHHHIGQMDAARASYGAALVVARELGDRAGESVLLANMGNLYEFEGRLDEARSYLDAALSVAREIGSRRLEGHALCDLGLLHRRQGRLDDARAHLDAALSVARETGDRRREGLALSSIGAVHEAQGRLDAARAHYEAALALHREVGKRRGEVSVLGLLAGLSHIEGRPDEAHAHFDAALVMAREVGDRRSEGGLLGHLADLHREAGRLDEARTCLVEGERLLREVRAPVLLGRLLCGRARLEGAEGRTEAARATLAEVEDIAARTKAVPDSPLRKALASARSESQPPR